MVFATHFNSMETIKISSSFLDQLFLNYSIASIIVLSTSLLFSRHLPTVWVSEGTSAEPDGEVSEAGGGDSLKLFCKGCDTVRAGDGEGNDTKTGLNVKGGDGVGTFTASTGDRDVKTLAQIFCEHLIL